MDIKKGSPVSCFCSLHHELGWFLILSPVHALLHTNFLVPGFVLGWELRNELPKFQVHSALSKGSQGCRRLLLLLSHYPERGGKLQNGFGASLESEYICPQMPLLLIANILQDLVVPN